MRVDNTMSFTPHGRRLGRGLVALVATAAICLSAARVSAAEYAFTIDQQQSSLGLSFFFTDGVTDNTGDDSLPYPHVVPGDPTTLNVSTFDPSYSAYLGYPYPGNVAPLAGTFNASIDVGTSIQLGAARHSSGTAGRVSPVAYRCVHHYAVRQSPERRHRCRRSSWRVGPIRF